MRSLIIVILVFVAFGGAILFGKDGRDYDVSQFDEAIAELQSELEARGAYISPKIRAVLTPNRGVGIIATTDIEPNEDIMKLPVEATLQIEQVHAAYPSWRFLDITQLGNNDFSLYAVYMAWLRNAKRYHVAIAGTSPDCFNGLHIESNQYDAMDAHARDMIAYQRWLFDQQWNYYDGRMNNSRIPRLTNAQYRWGVCIFQTRSATAASGHTIGTAVILPFYDFINHGENPNAIWFFDKVWHVRVTKAIKAGEEVVNSYGCRDNPSMLSAYGFFLPHSKCDRLLNPLGNEWVALIGWEGVPDEAQTLAKVYANQFQPMSQKPFDYNNAEHRHLTLGFIRDKARTALDALKPQAFIDPNTGEVLAGGHNQLLHDFVVDRRAMLNAGIDAIDRSISGTPQ